MSASDGNDNPTSDSFNLVSSCVIGQSREMSRNRCPERNKIAMLLECREREPPTSTTRDTQSHALLNGIRVSDCLGAPIRLICVSGDHKPSLLPFSDIR